MVGKEDCEGWTGGVRLGAREKEEEEEEEEEKDQDERVLLLGSSCHSAVAAVKEHKEG